MCWLYAAGEGGDAGDAGAAGAAWAGVDAAPGVLTAVVGGWRAARMLMAVIAAGVMEVIIVCTAALAKVETITAPKTRQAMARIAVTMTLSSPVSDSELLSIFTPLAQYPARQGWQLANACDRQCVRTN